MRDSIIESCTNGQVREGDVIPPLRELARQYGLSVNLAGEVVQALVAEGVLHARPGAGIIAGNPRPASPGTYLLLLPEGATPEYTASSYMALVQLGFEVAVAACGGACLTLEAGQALDYAANGRLPELAGIFAVRAKSLEGFAVSNGTSRAAFGEPGAEWPADATGIDGVLFDDCDGGRQAAEHLLAAGHEKIAFLAVHAPDEPGEFRWSAERERGWRQSMTEAGKSCDGMVFHPSRPHLVPADKRGWVPGSEQVAAAREAAGRLLQYIRARQVTAVVAANFYAALAFFNLLEETAVAPDLWPAVVCFDSFGELDNHVISALNLPWYEVGKAGAQLLWERNVGRLRGPGIVRRVPMQLIPRLTCRPDRIQASSLVMPQLQLLTAQDAVTPPSPLAAPGAMLPVP